MPEERKCSNLSCNITGPSLKSCGGICNGSVSYCSRECQREHFKIHKNICYKKARTDTLSVPHPQKGPSLPIPLKAYHVKDGFGKSALRLQYSRHLGETALNLFVIEYFGEIDDEMGWNAEGLTTIPWCIATSPVHDLTEQRGLRFGEAVFNTTKSKAEVDALLEAGIISDTRRKIQMGFYPPHPVCRINLPFADKEEHE